jgi:hypothetical protein
VAAWCAWQLPRGLGAPDAASRQLKKHSSLRSVELAPLVEHQAGGVGQAGEGQQAQGRPEEAAELLASAGAGGQLAGAVTHPERRLHQPAVVEEGVGGAALLAVQSEIEVEEEEEEQQQRHQAHQNGIHPLALGSRAGGAAALLAAAGAAAAEGLRALREGWRYVSGREQRDVAALVLMKCCAALVWGAVDLLNVKFSEMPRLQLGDASTTLGLIFATGGLPLRRPRCIAASPGSGGPWQGCAARLRAHPPCLMPVPHHQPEPHPCAVGLGCFVGPLAMNRVVAPRPAPLRWGVAASYSLFFLGLLVMGLSPNIALVLLSTFVRSMGEGVGRGWGPCSGEGTAGAGGASCPAARLWPPSQVCQGSGVHRPIPVPACPLAPRRQRHLVGVQHPAAAAAGAQRAAGTHVGWVGGWVGGGEGGPGLNGGGTGWGAH